MNLNHISASTSCTPPVFAQYQSGAIFLGDALSVLKSLRSHSFRCCITAPPYWGTGLRDDHRALGIESSFRAYLKDLKAVFHEVLRVLTDDGTLWLNMDDTYTVGEMNPHSVIGKPDSENREIPYLLPPGMKHKELVGIPWQIAFALRADGWFLRSEIIWHRPDSYGELVQDRPTRCHEYVFLFSKCKDYLYNREAVKEQSSVRGRLRNRRSVWSIPRDQVSDYPVDSCPSKLVELCLLAGTHEQDYVLDPFFGSGTVGVVCTKHNRQFIGIELKDSYASLASRRLSNTPATEAGVPTGQ
jgi:site-specific DNA-methyltransferase (cytosine-N4-specific)